VKNAGQEYKKDSAGFLYLDHTGTADFSIMRNPKCGSGSIAKFQNLLGLENLSIEWTKLLIPVRDCKTMWISGVRTEVYLLVDGMHHHPELSFLEVEEIFRKLAKEHSSFWYSGHADLYGFLDHIVEFCLLDDVWFCYLENMNKLEFWKWVEKNSDWGQTEDMFDKWIESYNLLSYRKSTTDHNIDRCIIEKLDSEPIIQMILEKHQSILEKLKKSHKWLEF
jgi:hypothetical protein